jgi:predicted DNA-binding protein
MRYKYTKSVVTFVEPEVWRKLQYMAFLEQRSAASIVRDLINAHVEAADIYLPDGIKL